ncbi:MAG: hypothetical protein KAS32_23570 [Candidatus Peribacteraceae bacterium]|nr:hypothetical protein [Candidatus Peribacteraceae bacterium]
MKLEIYMKSGNVIKLHGIKDWKIRYTNDTITYFQLIPHRFVFKRRILAMGALALGQIEAIVQI